MTKQKRNGVTESTLEELAKANAIEHRFCDPTPVDREENAIEQSDSDKREQFWLSRIQNCKNRNVLFVCGDDHVEFFTKKVIAGGFEVVQGPEILYQCSRSLGHLWALNPPNCPEIFELCTNLTLRQLAEPSKVESRPFYDLRYLSSARKEFSRRSNLKMGKPAVAAASQSRTGSSPTWRTSVGSS